MNAPAIRAQSQQSLAQPAAAATPKFEVASITPCGDDVAPDGRGMAIFLNCQTVAGYIGAAYGHFVVYAGNLTASVPIEGGPAWINSERYSINVSPELMTWPMLQALLEDRFKLKIHRGTREVPMYALTVAEGGPKLQVCPARPAGPVRGFLFPPSPPCFQPFKEGSCTPRPPRDLTKPFGPTGPWPALPPGQEYCVSLGLPIGPNMVVDAQGMSLDDFFKNFLTPPGRPVINKTGITGKFDFHLELALDEDLRGLVTGQRRGDPFEPVAPSIVTAVREQLGLKLEPAKGPGEFLVIDHVERPSEN